MQNNLTQAFIHLNNGDFSRARGAFQMALKLDENDIGAHSGMAAVLHHDQDFVGALTHSEAALKLDPRNTELHVHHAQYLLAANQPHKAKTSLKKAQRLGSDAPNTLYNLGVMHSIMGEFKQAKKCLLKANGLDKKNPQILEKLSHCLGVIPVINKIPSEFKTSANNGKSFWSGSRKIFATMKSI